MVAWSVTTSIPENDAAAPSIGVALPISRTPLADSGELGPLERGRVYYAQLCMSCHGVRGDGQGEWAYRVVPRPANLRSINTQARSDTELYDIISNGLAGTAMVGWNKQLSEAQRWQVVAYVRHLGAGRERGSNE
jgi:mono/diheme cytochrome c family protein